MILQTLPAPVPQLAVLPSPPPPPPQHQQTVKLSPIHTTTYYYYPASIDGPYQTYITPARTPTAKMPGRIVDFGSNTVCRPARDDERNVMQSFSAHAAHCARCDDPFRVYLHGGTLCDRGHAYARDVAQYVYSKAGKAYSVVDRNATDARVQIEIPAKCDAIRGLLKAVDQGLKVRSQNRQQSAALRPVVVSHDRTYPVPDRRLLPTERRDGYDVLEVAPRRREERKRAEGGGHRDRRRETIYVPTSSSSGKGSLYDKDAEERRRRRQSQGEPVIVYAEPRRRKEQYYR